VALITGNSSNKPASARRRDSNAAAREVLPGRRVGVGRPKKAESVLTGDTAHAPSFRAG